MPPFVRDNDLSLVLLSLFLGTPVGQYFTGWRSFNQDQQDHNQSPVSLREYLGEGHFIEGVFENWESEFLQDAVYVVFTVFLFRGARPSLKIPTSRRPLIQTRATHRTIPMLHGLCAGAVYGSACISTPCSSPFCSCLHSLLRCTPLAAQYTEDFSSEQLQHGGEVVSAMEYIGTSRFWYESFQNWQSEFLALFSMVAVTRSATQRVAPAAQTSRRLRPAPPPATHHQAQWPGIVSA